MVRVMGVDAAGPRWVGVTSDQRVYADHSIEELMALADADGVLDVVAIDIPIGLPDAGRRLADVLAGSAVGPLRASVFTTPPRSVLQAESYAEAIELSQHSSGKGVSRQSWALGPKILEVDDVVHRSTRTIVEFHPEVSFATLAGRPLTTRKKTWAGQEERRALLAGAGIVVPADVGRAGLLVGPDDVLDAAVGSWSAQRYADGVSVSFPPEPEQLDGIAVAIHA
ncbi:DUF429 domain-containing protein [Antribacter sp. KLBMP9083]|uniref:DUF429 domain-containing protein n=1 Tax=Antribacter soli TaxID=2910976 RepID=A0AA41QFJ0_9MICO|nr:DUF429 domain-containing protein [Antribacter soli]MCF4121164.1 DUF429 domain-containing protein [Antribacter soli]